MPDEILYRRALFEAISTGDVRTASRVLQAFPDAVRWRNDDIDAKTPLIAAAARGDERMVKLLLLSNAEVDGTNANGSTAMMFAAQEGHVSVMAILFQMHADPNHQNKNGTAAVMAAAYNGHGQAVATLVEVMGALTAVKDVNGMTAQQHAEDGGFKDIAAYLSAAAMKELKKSPAPPSDEEDVSGAFNKAAEEEEPAEKPVAETEAAEEEEAPAAPEAKPTERESHRHIKSLAERLRNANLTGQR